MFNKIWFPGILNWSYDTPNVEIKVIEGAAFVNIYTSIASNTHGKCCDMELKPKVLQVYGTTFKE